MAKIRFIGLLKMVLKVKLINDLEEEDFIHQSRIVEVELEHGSETKAN